jgi:CheY-like chemotaxis protein
MPDAALDRPVILIAEDEVLVRMMIADVVQDAGFKVIEAADALEALRVLEARADVSVLITDIEMPPGPSGLDLAAEVRQRWPFVQVIVTSGRVRPSNDEVPQGVVFIPKPWRAESMARCVIEAVERVEGMGPAYPRLGIMGR